LVVSAVPELPRRAHLRPDTPAGIVSPNNDYPALRRSMMRLAHELVQSNVMAVCFGVMLPEHILANSDLVSYFESLHFLLLDLST
jgi:hypothetical protein